MKTLLIALARSINAKNLAAWLDTDRGIVTYNYTLTILGTGFLIWVLTR